MKLSNARWVVAALAVLVWTVALPQHSRAQGLGDDGAGFTQVTRPVAELTNAERIDELLNELVIIPEIPLDSINRVEVIDITENGYGPDDVLVVYPSQETFMIQAGTITGRAQEMMNSWVLESEFQYDGANVPASALRPDSAQAQDAAQYGIMADVIESVNRNYAGESISLLLERGDETFTVQMWDYNSAAMQYEPRPAGPPDTLRTRDLLYVVRSDSVVYDVVYVEKTVEETEYIPGGPTSSTWPRGEEAPGRENGSGRSPEPNSADSENQRRD